MARKIDVSITTAVFDSDAAEILSVVGEERINQPYQFDIDLVYRTERHIPVEAMIGSPARLTFSEDSEELRHIDGIIIQARDGLDEQTAARWTRLRLVPRAHRLTLIRTQEVYLGLSVPDIIQQKLELCHVPCELRLTDKDAYPARDIIVQYAETDLAFISRLCEHLGLSFFVDAQKEGDTLVFTDDNRFRRLPGERATVPFRGRGEHLDIHDLDREANIIPSVYLVSDYNYQTPLVDVIGQSQSPVGGGGGQVEFGAHVKNQAEAEAIATIRRQEAECRRVQFFGKADRPYLGAGTLFELDEHPFFEETELLITEARHEVRQVGAGGSTGDLSYVNQFVAVNAKNPFRPERLAPRPRIYGIVSAIVEPSPGSDGTQPWIDDQGRYTVRILFDTADHGEKASHAVRMAQAHAGQGYGTHFPLRPGTEVLMAFIDGNVDRPIIIGAAPNTVTPSVVASDEHLHHRIRTASGVQIEFEDGF